MRPTGGGAPPLHRRRPVTARIEHGQSLQHDDERNRENTCNKKADQFTRRLKTSPVNGTHRLHLSCEHSRERGWQKLPHRNCGWGEANGLIFNRLQKTVKSENVVM
ncbi:hypothetical protein GCM10022254_23740 [Actinomadura meridiana]|uniref:Uncharacterized protein n=1 Tax=Actinomadura meridiana TaxID=559626 RepID=A0ABP8BXU5_9ACTN